MGTKALRRILEVNGTSARNNDVRYMNKDLRSLAHKSSMGIATIVKILGIEKMNAHPSPNGHLTNLKCLEMHLRKVTLMIRITIPSIAIIIIKNMDMFLKIV